MRWQCLVCTFAGNRGGVLRCALCDTLKGSRAWQPPRSGTLSKTLAGAAAATLAETPDLLSSALRQEQGSCDRVGLGLVGSGGKGAPSALAVGASGGAVPAARGAEEPGVPASAAAEAPGARTMHESGGNTASSGGAAEGLARPETMNTLEPSAEPDWEPAEGPHCSGWRCRRCGEVVGGRDLGLGLGSESPAGAPGEQARAEHDDYHLALALQRAESLTGAPGGRAGSGLGFERGPAAAHASGAGRGTKGRKRRASGNPTPGQRGVRSGRGTMDAFLQRADVNQS